MLQDDIKLARLDGGVIAEKGQMAVGLCHQRHGGSGRFPRP